MPTISVHVDEATFKLVGQLAKRDERSKSWIVTHALKRQLAHERWMIEETEKALADVRAGRAKLVEHDDVVKRSLARARKLDAE